MSEEKENKKPKKNIGYYLKKIITVTLFCFILYYALLSFVLQISPTENKIMLAGVSALFLLWIFAKKIITLVLSISVILLILYSWYYFTHYDEIACKNSGGVWYAKEQVCKEKVDIIKRIKDVWENRTFFKTSENEIKKQ